MKAKGYKVAAELDGTTLTAKADGKIGRAALGEAAGFKSHASVLDLLAVLDRAQVAA